MQRVIIGLSILALFGCDRHVPQATVEKKRPVRVLRVVSQERPVQLHYTGTTNSKSIKKYSFKVAGKIRKIFVSKGQKIQKGQRLAQLDTRDLSWASEASRLTLKKADEAYRNSQKFFGRVEKLYQQKASPQIDYDRAKLNRDVSEATLSQARIDYDSKRGLLADTRMVSEVDGYVVDVLNKAGEIVAAGYPVVIVRNDRQVVNAGVSQRDVKKLRVGTKAQLSVDGAVGEGHVINISQIPDMRSRTYEVEIELTGKLTEHDFYIGSIAKVAFEIGSGKGVWLPIPAIMTDGVDYVYVVESQRAVRKNLDLLSITGNEVLVSGLQEGAQVIVEGMKNLKEGYRVSVVAETAEPKRAQSTQAKL